MIQAEKDRAGWFAKILQIVFFVVVSGGTIFNSCQLQKQSELNEKQWNLIYYPVAGIVDVKTTRYLINLKEKDTYENVAYATVQFVIKNTGNLPLKDFKFNVRTKIGNTTLSFEENPEMKKGIRLLQGMITTNQVTIQKAVMERMLNNKERCITTYQFSYSDWKGYKSDSYTYACEIKIIQKSPLSLIVIPVSTEEA